MNYKIIPHQWRPKNFQELIGQDPLKNTLMNALKLNRLPQALIFSGQRGTGKTSTARILAKSLRCLETFFAKEREQEKERDQKANSQIKDGVKKKNSHFSSIEPCQNCEECLEIHKGINPNVIEIDGASHTGVDSIRALTTNVSYTPSTGHYKIYIIDEVHMLSTSAFNALLKTLEEPPNHVYFILATTEIHKIPATILSRCQKFDFKRIPTRVIFDQLQNILKKENILAESQVLWEIARQGEGSLRDAQSLLDQLISYSSLDQHKKNPLDQSESFEPPEPPGLKNQSEQKNTLTLDKAIQVLGFTDRSLILETLSCILSQDFKRALKLMEKIYFTGVDLGEFVKSLLGEFRNLLVVKMFLKNPMQNSMKNFQGSLVDEKSIDFEDFLLFDISKEEILQLRDLSQNVLEEDIHFLFDILVKGSQDLLLSRDSKTVFEMLLLRMTQALRLESLQSWMGKSLPSKSRETEIFFPKEN